MSRGDELAREIRAEFSAVRSVASALRQRPEQDERPSSPRLVVKLADVVSNETVPGDTSRENSPVSRDTAPFRRVWRSWWQLSFGWGRPGPRRRVRRRWPTRVRARSGVPGQMCFRYLSEIRWDELTGNCRAYAPHIAGSP